MPGDVSENCPQCPRRASGRCTGGDAMGSREDILGALRSVTVPARPAPDLSGLGVRFPDRVAQLEKMVEAVGGTLVRAASLTQAGQALAKLAPVKQAKKVLSLVPSVGTSTVDLDAIAAPHALHDLDVAVLRGEFAVAENGAVWVDSA